MFDKLGQLKDLWKLKSQMEELKKRLDNMVIKVGSPNHLLELTISGSQEIKEVAVDPTFKNYPIEKLNEELKVTINKAIRDSQAMAAQAMGGAMGADLPKA